MMTFELISIETGEVALYGVMPDGQGGYRVEDLSDREFDQWNTVLHIPVTEATFRRVELLPNSLLEWPIEGIVFPRCSGFACV